ncbi:MAG TPA: C39 family peptidase [Aggregatilineales bacterium]|nr:C39 family peptidase [Aggregatilineales bacterium]
MASAPVTQVLEVSPTPEAIVTESLPSMAYISGLRHEFQTWNNCGPATITMGLSHFGWIEDQTFAASFLKPNEEDKNVTPREMVRFVNGQTNIRALTRMGGTLELLRSFISSGFPVIVSIGYAPEGEDWFGHYRAVIGYDDSTQNFYAYDSYLGTGEDGRGLVVPYSEFDSGWQDFNRNFIVLYEQGNDGRVASILGERVDVMRAAELALEIAQRETELDPRNGFAWFNLGTSLVALERYDEATRAYDMAQQHELPWRMLWYQFGPYEAYFAVGRLDDVTALVMANLNNGGAYVEETHF